MELNRTAQIDELNSRLKHAAQAKADLKWLEAEREYAEILGQALQPGDARLQYAAAVAASGLLAGRDERGDRAADETAEVLANIGRNAMTGEAASLAALGLLMHAEHFLANSRPDASEQWFHSAKQLGIGSNTKDGLYVAARASGALLELSEKEKTNAEWTASVVEIADLARRSSEPISLAMAAAYALAAAQISLAAGDPKGARKHLRLAERLGFETRTADGLHCVGAASLLLGSNLLRRGGPRRTWSARGHLRIAATLSMTEPTSAHSVQMAAIAWFHLGLAYGKGKPALASYREAIRLGRIYGSPVGLEMAAAAAINAAALEGEERRSEGREHLAEAVNAGRASGRSQGFLYASLAAGRLASAHAIRNITPRHD